ncbi:hypothetical protein AC1031_005760 [Aphanomyces cochlioides]|nr:hypothetical protein AC1031_005760 [Aphanomyces cochlioides]
MKRHVTVTMVLVTMAICLAKTIDYDRLERQWEAGDHEDELLSDDELEYKRRGTLDKSEMVFVSLNEAVLRKRKPTDPAISVVSELCATWKQMLLQGGLTVNFYELEAYKVLAGMQHGSRVKELRDFFLEQDEVTEVTWDQNTFRKPKKKRKRKDEL